MADTRRTPGTGYPHDGDEAEDRPHPDEVHSAFTPPSGLPAAPAPAEAEHPTSEFALPEGFRPPAQEAPGSAFRTPGDYPDFTPATGIPAVQLARRNAPWQDRMRTMVRLPLSERPAPPERAPRAEDEQGPPVPRVLDLTLRIGELLLAGGEGAEDVEAAMFGVAHAYGLDRCEPTVTFTLLSVTHQPSLVDDPVTLSRTVRRRGTDYTRLAAVYRLVADITSDEEDVTLEEAYRRLAEMRRNRHPYSKNALTLASGVLAGAAATLVGGGPVVFVLAALGAMLGDRLAWVGSSRGLPEFYQFVSAAMPPAAIGVTVALLERHDLMHDVRASAVVTGGLFALIPGRALVAAVHDGLTGFYITASARLLEVVYLIVGIVCGVLMILYVGDRLGGALDPDQVYSSERPPIQLAAAMLLALAFCVLLQQERGTVLLATVNGGVAWLIYAVLAHTADADPVFATVIAAGLVGLFGQLMSRYQFVSALPYVTAAIGPLLPGSATYYGLLNIAQGNVNGGFQYLSTAAALALAIAIGVNLGGEVARLFITTPGLESPLPGRRAAKRTRGF
ncbi:threonine/serine exporter family protein [Streptomyces sp. TRM 70351]|uniref:threonine/serine ThrE exporter family protein n=1 Tax=Streptomyces sp. TRM 70351 TaxID=3116552 RepID=UPI002E7AC89E|nr:threonine/serine exporter family protein [Streptomyces sp. TRM 70351]MEE1930352.1 threonine/serine exporter family protein [Streptomyces sp. TRM 70351]